MLDNLFTPTHLLFVLAIALLVFGPRKLPELGKGLGEGLRGFKQGIKGDGEPTVAKAEAAKTLPKSSSCPRRSSSSARSAFVRLRALCISRQSNRDDRSC